MAVCEIWDVKGRLDHPIDYAKNPEKTVNPKYTEADLQALFSALNSILVIDKIIMYNTRRITKCLFQIRFIQEQEIHKSY